MHAQDSGCGDEGLLALNRKSLRCIREQLAKSLHFKVFAIEAKQVRESVQQSHGSRRRHPNLRITSRFHAFQEILLHPVTEPFEQTVLVIAIARVRDAAEFRGLTDSSASHDVHARVFTGHRNWTEHKGVGMNRYSLIRRDSDGAAIPEGQQARQNIHRIQHLRRPALTPRLPLATGQQALFQLPFAGERRSIDPRHERSSPPVSEVPLPARPAESDPRPQSAPACSAWPKRTIPGNLNGSCSAPLRELPADRDLPRRGETPPTRRDFLALHRALVRGKPLRPEASSGGAVPSGKPARAAPSHLATERLMPDSGG